MSDRRVVITGVGLINSLGIGKDAYFQALCDGKIGIDRIRRFDPSGFPSQVAGESPELKISRYVPKAHRKATKLMSRDIQLAVVAADLALRDAQLVTKGTQPGEPANIDPTRSGVNIGAGLICCDLVELGAAAKHALEGGKFSYQKWGMEGMESLTPLWLLKYLPNMVSCHISIIHDLQGPSNSITCAEASGQLAIGEAFRQIRHGKADLVVAGGAESKVDALRLMRKCFIKMASQEYNDCPAEACRPFDSAATGTVIGEGAGIVVLEELEHALSRQAPILAEITGFGGSINFCEDFVEPESSGAGIALALQKALQEASLSADALQLLIPHGLGVATHDAAEAQAICSVFGDRTQQPPIFATKSRIGNCGAASGAIDLVTTVLALSENRIPPTLNCPNPPVEYGLNIHNTETLETPIENAATCCYTFGGQTAALVLSQFQPQRETK